MTGLLRRDKRCIRVAINGLAASAAIPSGHFEANATISKSSPSMTRPGRDQRPSVALRLGAWPLPGTVTVDGDSISLATGQDQVTSVRDPATLPWKELGIRISPWNAPASQRQAKASAHLTAGAKRVLVSAPSDGADATIVFGVNHDKLTKDHLVVSTGFVHHKTASRR